MPIFQANTTSIHPGKYPNGAIWQSPDGQRSMWEISMATPTGQATPGLKTYSESIAKVGFNGQIETYEKQGRNGIETFVRQYQDPANAPQGNQVASSGGAQYTPAPVQAVAPDNSTILISCAKDIVVALIASGKPVDGEYHEYLLRKMGVQHTSSDPDATTPSKEELNGIFGSTENITADDGSAPAPWASQSQ